MTAAPEALEDWLVARLAARAGVGADDVDPTVPFANLGLSSKDLLALAKEVAAHVGREVGAADVFNYPTIESLARYLTSAPAPSLRPAAAATERSDEPIAILGIGCRFPGGVEDLESFWRVLRDGVDTIREVPSSRWDAGALFDADPDAAGKSTTRWGGFLADIDRFDPDFFGISPREAARMDPQHRLLLETTWEAIERAGLPLPRLAGSDTGVFVGLCYQEYAALIGGLEARDGYVGTGSAASIASGRISYVLGLKGPSLTIDTACSSSLVAVHLACQSLLRGECSTAVAGGVTLMLTPAPFVEFSRLRGLAPDGRCKAFSADADGVAWGEGCGVVVLKRLSDAQRDGDPILALIRGTAVNQDGRSNGLTAPNGLSQEAMLRQALQRAGVSSSEVGYVECHGTGTTLGDPIEAQALGAAFADRGPADEPVLLGSVKTNFGHTQAAAGVAGLIKCVLALQQEVIPKSLHFRAGNPHVAWQDLPLRVAAEPVRWPRNGAARIAGVSSFGFSGTNAHAVLEEAPVGVAPVRAPERSAELFVLSARTPAALAASAARLRDWVRDDASTGLGDLAYSLLTTRSEMEHRAAFVASSREALTEALEEIARGDATITGSYRPEAAGPKVAFVFPGHGSQWLGMGRELLREEPAFRSAMEACDAAIRAEAGWSVIEELQATVGGSRLQQVDVVQPVLFAMGVSLAALWRSWGVEPQAVVGHSLGEVAAACVAGALTIRDAAAVVCRRSRLLRQIVGKGEMALVELSLPEAEAALRAFGERLSVAVNNSPRTTVVSGDPAAMEDLLRELEGRGVFCRRVKVDYASHSSQVDPILDDLVAALDELTPRAARVPMHSTLTGTVLEGFEVRGRYWADNLRQPVRFAETVQRLLGQGFRLFVEMSPHPLLVAAVEELRQGAGLAGAATGSLRRDQPERRTLLETLGALHANGQRLEVERLFQEGGRRVPLPTYPWQRERHWVEAPPPARGGIATGHPLLGERLVSAATEVVFETSLSTTSPSWATDHRVAGRAVVPGAVHAELARAAGAHHRGAPVLVTSLVFQAPLVLPERGARRVQVVVAEGGERASIHSRPEDGDGADAWTLHATAELAPAPAAAARTLGDLASRGGDPVDVAGAYEGIASLGIDFGPAFRGLRSVRRLSPQEAVAEVALPDSVPAAGYGLHPALFDAAIQATIAFEEGGAPGARLLFAIDRLVVHAPGEASSTVHLRLGARGAEGLSVDLTMFGASGAVIAEAEGLRLRPAAFEKLDASDPEPSEAVHQVEWQPAPVLRDALAPVLRDAVASTGAAAAGTWALVPCEGGIPDGLLDALRALGASAEEVPAHRLGAAPADHVVCVWGGAEASHDEVDAARRRLSEALAVVKALTAARAETRLWWVTRGAVSLGAEGASPSLASLWGLGRTAMQELPDLRCTLLDVEANADASRLAELLAREAAPSSDDETQVAWRGSERRVPRLVHTGRSAGPGGPALRGPATVLITGGLGALGRHVARGLAASEVRLLLVGRRGLDAPGAAEFVAELEGAGAEVTVAALDVSDRSAVARALAALPPDRPLRAVVHAAGALDDGVLAEQTDARFAGVLEPKARGAWNLHELTEGLDLDAFVLFSSVAGALGAAGTGAYAAANAFLDALAAHRRARGLPAQSLAWGPWAGDGMGTVFDASVQARLARQAMGRLDARRGVALLVEAMARPEAALVLAPIERRALQKAFAGEVPPVWRALAGDERAGAAPSRGAWAEEIARLAPTGRREAVERAVRAEVARVLGVGSASAVSMDRALKEMGLDSLMSVTLRNALGRLVGKKLPATLAFDHPTPGSIVAYLLERLGPAPASSPVAAPRSLASDDDPIAIVGMSCRFPGGADDVASFWKLLEQGIDAITEVPADRWDADAWFDPDPSVPGKMTSRWGGFLEGLDRFEPGFFELSNREAPSVDPQERLLLETAWEAFEDAGITRDALMGSDTGVFVGVYGTEYQHRALADVGAPDPYGLLGTAHSTMVGRLSYWLGLKGPNMPVDTACSSSLVAVHLACQALRHGECRAAIAGGVNVILGPETSVHLSRLRALSPTGRCRAFSADADGFVRSEGAGMVVLERLSDARRHGHRVLALVRGTAVNQDGRSNGLTAPNGPSQIAVVRQALARAGVAPARVEYVECHGTGTTLGDPIEVQALGAALGEGRPADRPIVIGSVKSNLGHTEGAAGVAGLIKCVLALQHGVIPKSLHVGEVNPHVAWSDLPVRVASEAVGWPRRDAPRIAGVSSFGFSGTNAHAVLEEAPLLEGAERRVASEGAPSPARAELVVLSARTASALQASARRLREHLASDENLDLGDLAYSLAATRTSMPWRLAVAAPSRAALERALEGAAKGERVDGASAGEFAGDVPPQKIAFVFPGHGADWAGAGRELLGEEPAFREALTACDAAIAAEAGWSVLALLQGERDPEHLRRVEIVQPLMFAVGVSLAALWRSWGVEPHAVVGHSMGEVAAASVAGALSLADGAAIVCRRAERLRPLVGRGGLALVALSPSEVEAALPAYEGISIAALNSAHATVVSGATEPLGRLLADLEGRGVFCRRVKIEYASHSEQVDPLLDDFARAIADVAPREASVPFHSTLTGTALRGPELSARYWADNLRRPVRFAEAIRSALDEGVRLFVEMSPHPALVPAVEDLRREATVEGLAVGSLRRDRPERLALLEGLAALHTHGLRLDAARLFPHGGRRVPLPTYPWQRERHWLPDRPGPSPQADSRPAAPADDRFLEIVWEPAPRGPACAGHARVVVVGDGMGLGAALTAALQAAGHRATHALHPDVHALPALLAASFGADAPTAVVHLGALDGPAGLTPAAIEGALRRGCDPLLAIVQALTGGSFRDAPRLWVVTRGAQAPGDARGVAQSPVLGLCRVIALEHPELRCARVDLAPEQPGGDAEELAAEVLADDGEDEVALRGGERRVARIARKPLARGSGVRVRKDGSYLVTGGLGGLGLVAARWLAERGAGHVVLVGRSGADKPAQREEVEAIEALGARVTVVRADAANREAMEAAVAAAQAPGMPLRGILHAAGLVDDGLLAQQTPERLRRVMTPKALGALHLHALTVDVQLDFFVSYASAAGLFGSPGQGNYAAANTFLDALAQHRRAVGLPALSVDWGSFSEVGLAAAQGNRGARLASRGMRNLTPDEGLRALETLLEDGCSRAAVVTLDVRQWVDFYPAAASSRMLSRLVSEPRPASRGDEELLRALSAGTPAARAERVHALLREQVSQVLGIDASGLALDAPLTNQGLDSLMGLELRNRIEAALGVNVPATLLWSYGNVRALTQYLLGILFPAPPPAPHARPHTHARGEGGAIDELEDVVLDGASLEGIEQLIDKEFEELR